MNLCALAVIGTLAFTDCGSANGESSSKTAATADTVKTGATVAFSNGITDANKGMKKGKVQLKGTTQAPGVKKLYLYLTEGKNKSKIDSTSVTGNAFDFGTKEYESGFYLLGTNDDNTGQIIISTMEPVVEISINQPRFENGLSAINSKENEGWFKYLPQEVALLKSIKDNKMAQYKSSMKSQFDQVIAQKENELATLRANTINQYPNTFLAKVITWKQEPAKDKGRFWKNIDFTDESLIHTMIMTDRTQDFMRNYSGGNESGYYTCIDLLVQEAKVNDRVLEFTLYNTLSGFYESGMDNVCLYIMDNYIFGDACPEADISSVLKKQAEGFGNLQIGKIPPDIVGTGHDGSGVGLLNIASRHKYTLIMFWSSWCEHCQGEAPEIKQYYEIWHPKGFEILGVSIDTNPTAWKNAITQRGFTFPNVCGMKNYDSKYAKDYKVVKTPTFFLLDSSGKIVLKPKGIREVNQWLTQNLK